MTSTQGSPKITLHWLEASRSHRVMWLFEEAKIPYELKTYKRNKDKLADPALKKIHPLGKAPIVTIETAGSDKPLVLAESGNIFEYFCDHYGQSLVPKRYKDGQEGKVGGETEAWLRYRYYLHYSEGTLMPFLLISLLMSTLKGPTIPFFLRPITSAIAGKIESAFVTPNLSSNYGFLESQLATSPDGGQYLCGKSLSAADLIMSFPIEAAREGGAGITKEKYPKLWAYIDLLHENEAYKRCVEKIKAIEGEFKLIP